MSDGVVRARRAEGGALPERRPGGAEADGPGAVTASRPAHDQAAGGGRGSAALDLLPHVSGDGGSPSVVFLHRRRSG